MAQSAGSDLELVGSEYWDFVFLFAYAEGHGGEVVPEGFWGELS